MGTTRSMNDWLALLQTDDAIATSDSTWSEGEPASEAVPTVTEPDHPSTEVVTVAYQKISYDWAIADGTYTPQQLRKAKVVVKAWGTEQTYPLTWSPSTPGDAAEAQHPPTPPTTGDW